MTYISSIDMNQFNTKSLNYVTDCVLNKQKIDTDNFTKPYGLFNAGLMGDFKSDNFYANGNTLIAQTNSGAIYFNDLKNTGNINNIKINNGLEFADIDSAIKTLTGKQAEQGYEYRVGSDEIYEMDTNTVTLDKTDGEFSISAEDAKKLLDAEKSGKNIKDEAKNLLLDRFGGNELNVLRNLSDNANANNYDVFGQVVDKFVTTIKNGSFINNNAINTSYRDTANQSTYNLSLDIDSYKGVNFSDDFWNGIELENVGGNGGSWGDPHFELSDEHMFDFQGENGKTYKLLDNKDMNLVSKFSGNDSLTVVSDQNLTLKGTDIEVESHMNGTFEVYKTDKNGNRTQIGDQTNYSDPEVQQALIGEGINLNFTNNKNLSVTYKNKTINQDLTGGYINNKVDMSLLVNSQGVLAQTLGAKDQTGVDDNKYDGLLHYDSDKDGDIDTLSYDANNQYFLYEKEKSHKRNLTDADKTAIEADFNANKDKPIALRFVDGHGYDRADWNEYFGSKLFEVTYSDPSKNPFAD